MNERFIFHQKMNERLMSVKLFLSMINETGNLMEEFIIRLKKNNNYIYPVYFINISCVMLALSNYCPITH